MLPTAFPRHGGTAPAGLQNAALDEGQPSSYLFTYTCAKLYQSIQSCGVAVAD
jgi:hypothetical protein